MAFGCNSVWGSEIDRSVGLTYGMWCFAFVEGTWVSNSLAASLSRQDLSILFVKSIDRLNVSPAFYYHSRCWWRWQSNVMSSMHTFPWYYLTNIILFPFCHAGSRSSTSTMSHQLRTNQRNPSYPINTAVANDVLNDTCHSTIHHLHRFLSTTSNHIHPFIQPSSRCAYSISNIPIYSSLLPHASHFLHLYKRQCLPFLVSGKSLVIVSILPTSSHKTSTPTPTIESTYIILPSHRQTKSSSFSLAF